MNELREETLTTADIVNPPGREMASKAAVEPETENFNGQPPAPNGQPAATNGQQATNGHAQHNPLFPQDELQNFRSRWDQVQTSFVDEPRAAVEQADSLVANVVKRIAEQFASERSQLEGQWDRGENIDTEELRQALKRYRAFFDRLLAF